MDFTGKPMRGFVYVAARGIKTQARLRRCVDAALAYVTALPAKRPRAQRRRARPIVTRMRR